MRIIAGLAKGRSLDAVASSTRPTSDRAREALFSTLTSEFGGLEGLRVLDLYSGTGAIALESLSRGAALVHAVEKDEAAAKAIHSNYESLKSAQCPGTFHLYAMNVHRFLQDKSAQSYHFIYLDPPYDVSDIDVIESLILIRDGGFLDSQGIIAVERNSRTKEISWPEGFSALREKNYGQATIFYAFPTRVDGENG
jgi:16S rRNA (guanine966-N2)-methyltransferase